MLSKGRDVLKANTAQEKVFQVIVRFQERFGRGYPTNDSIARETGYSIRIIPDFIRSLEKSGRISREGTEAVRETRINRTMLGIRQKSSRK